MDEKRKTVRLAVCIASYVAAALFGVRALGTLLLWWIGRNGGVVNTGAAVYAFGIAELTFADLLQAALPCLVMLAVGVYCTVNLLRERKQKKKETN